MKKTNKKGFTLVELLVVIAIIAILSVVSIVGYTSFTTRAKESNAKTELSQVTTYMYAATAITDSHIVFNTAQNGFEVSVPNAEADDAAIKNALYFIREAVDDAAAAGRLSLVAGDNEASVSTDHKTVTFKTLYYTSKDGIVAKWTVEGNVVEVAKTHGTLVSEPSSIADPVPQQP